MSKFKTACENPVCSEFDKEKPVEFKEENKIVYMTTIKCTVCGYILLPERIE